VSIWSLMKHLSDGGAVRLASKDITAIVLSPVDRPSYCDPSQLTPEMSGLSGFLHKVSGFLHKMSGFFPRKDHH
jgi:hypothetical protein